MVSYKKKKKYNFRIQRHGRIICVKTLFIHKVGFKLYFRFPPTQNKNNLISKPK